MLEGIQWYGNWETKQWSMDHWLPFLVVTWFYRCFLSSFLSNLLHILLLFFNVKYSREFMELSVSGTFLRKFTRTKVINDLGWWFFHYVHANFLEMGLFIDWLSNKLIRTFYTCHTWHCIAVVYLVILHELSCFIN